MNKQQPVRGPSVKQMLAIVLIAIACIVIGTLLSDSIKQGFELAGSFVGFGHDHEDHAQQTEGGGYYTCGMHPWVIQRKPGNCPICQMELTPIDPDKFTGEVSIDPTVVQNIGVRVSPVTRGPLVRTIRTVGTVDYNEPLVRDINIKVAGWIEKLYVDYLGAEVKAGDQLFDLYSPELYAAQEEYLLAYHHRDAVTGSESLLEAARTRLLYFDITSKQIAQLEAADKPTKAMAIRSPYRGVVIQKHANEGMKVDPGMRVYRIADLSKVWVMVTLYEYQLPFVQVGQQVTMTLPYIPGQAFEGEVIYIYPYLDKKTREVQIRLEFDNAEGLLKPGMFANVDLKSTLARERTLAPREAIIDTGERQVAFVSLGEGKFEPRDVHVGIETSDGKIEILEGLEPNELVVTSGQFLLDSEAKIRDALAKMIKGELAVDQEPVVAAAEANDLVPLPQEVSVILAKVLDHSFAIGDKLASDTIEGVSPLAEELAAELKVMTEIDIPDSPHFWHEHQEARTARQHALGVEQAADLEEARLSYANLSTALIRFLKAAGVPATYASSVQELHCPMYREGQGGSIWMQPAGQVRNPYFGTSMLSCFDKRETLPAAAMTNHPQTSGDTP